MEYIYKIIEQNVNGFGENAEMFVKTFEALTSNEIKALKNILSEVKASAEDYDTEDMVEESCELFNKRFSTQIETISGPYVMEITF